MKTNIALICLLDSYSKNVAKLLSEKLEMFYVDIDEMVEFELGDAEHIVETLGNSDGQKYIQKCEDKVVSNVSSFENTIISLNPATMFSDENFKIVSSTSFVIYLQIAPKYFEIRAKFSGDTIDKELNDICFTDRDKLYVDKSDIVLNCSTYKAEKAVKKLLKVINKFFKKLSRESKKRA